MNPSLLRRSAPRLAGGLLVLCAAVTLACSALSHRAIAQEPGSWAFFAANDGVPGPAGKHRAQVLWEDGRRAVLSYDEGDDRWTLTVTYPGHDRMEERRLGALYAPKPARSRNEEHWVSLTFAADDYRTDLLEGDRTSVTLTLPKTFIAHIQAADALYLDAGQDAVAIPLSGSAKAIAQVYAALGQAGGGEGMTMAEIMGVDELPDVPSNAEVRRRGESEEVADFSGAAQGQIAMEVDEFLSRVEEQCLENSLDRDVFASAGYAMPEDPRYLCILLLWGEYEEASLTLLPGFASPDPSDARVLDASDTPPDIRTAPDIQARRDTGTRSGTGTSYEDYLRACKDRDVTECASGQGARVTGALPSLPGWPRFLCSLGPMKAFVACINDHSAAVEALLQDYEADLASAVGLPGGTIGDPDNLPPAARARVQEVVLAARNMFAARDEAVRRELDSWFVLPEPRTCRAPALVEGSSISNMEYFTLGYRNYVDCIIEDNARARAHATRLRDDRDRVAGMPTPGPFEQEFEDMVDSRMVAMWDDLARRAQNGRAEVEAWEEEASRLYGVRFE